MKVTYLSTARIPDGWAHVIQILKMCEAFADEGVEVELVVPARAATPAGDPFAYAGVRKNFTITRLPCLDLFPGSQSPLFYWLCTFTFFLAARAYLASHPYDLLYTREPFAPGNPAKTVFELHSLYSTGAALQRLARAKAIIAITKGLAEDLIDRGVSRERVMVAPDGVDLAAFAHPEEKTSARVRLGLPEDAKIALYIGILDPWKGTDTLYAAAALVAPDVRTVVIGGFEGEEKRLQAKHPEVRFLGYRPYTELPNNQQAADVLILPNSGKKAISAKYTSPLKLFSYMASGIPIVASDLSSLREVLDERTAFLVAPDSPEALAAGIRTALNDPEEAKRRADKAKEAVAAYTWKKRAQSILAFV